MADIALPTLSVVLATAAVDAVNPCAIGVLVILLATLIKLGDNKKKILTLGLIYIIAVFLTYLLAGFGLLLFIQQFAISYYLSWVVAVIIIILGLIEFKDAFSKKAILAISPKFAKRIKHRMHHLTFSSSVILGIFVAAVELPCTGGPYLAIITVLEKIGFSTQVFLLLVLYNFIFILPLLIIVLLVYFGYNVKKIQNWKDANKKGMRIATAIVLLLLGVLLILWNESIILL